MVSERLKVAWYFIARAMCAVFCKLFFRMRVYGRENIPAEGAFIVACNHQSWLDPVFCGISSPRRLLYMARDTLFANPVGGAILRSVNVIPLSRDKADIGAMKRVIAKLKEGNGVCLFPEGTRSRDGKIVPFKPGFGLLCRRSKSMVIPTLVDGAFECWPRHQKLFRPGKIALCFGKPLMPDEIRKMSNEELADHLTKTLWRMQHDCRTEQGKEPFDYSTEPLSD